jgi:hypothetical protein
MPESSSFTMIGISRKKKKYRPRLVADLENVLFFASIAHARKTSWVTMCVPLLALESI